MSTPRGFYSRSRRIESVRRVRTPINHCGDSGPVAESGHQYQPRESLYNRPSLRRHLDDGDSNSGDEGNPESEALPASLSLPPKPHVHHFPVLPYITVDSLSLTAVR